MSTIVGILLFGFFIIVPCWKSVIAGLLLEKDPERWQKWNDQENERRKKRDERVGRAVNAFMRAMDWIGEKLIGGNSHDGDAQAH
jgi:hypothetical protein